MSVQLLPQDAARDTDSEPGDSRENSRGEHNPEEIPQPARKAARVELFGQQSPGEWSGADEPDEERDIRRNVLYRAAPKLVELGFDGEIP